MCSIFKAREWILGSYTRIIFISIEFAEICCKCVPYYTKVWYTDHAAYYIRWQKDQLMRCAFNYGNPFSLSWPGCWCGRSWSDGRSLFVIDGLDHGGRQKLWLWLSGLILGAINLTSAFNIHINVRIYTQNIRRCHRGSLMKPNTASARISFVCTFYGTLLGIPYLNCDKLYIYVDLI